MCLYKLEKFTPARVGYQVKIRREEVGSGSIEYESVYWSKTMSVGMKFEGRGRDIACHTRGTYKSGPHVFHKRTDAEKYLRLMIHMGGGLCVVKLKVHGSYCVGSISWPFRDSREVEAKVTVAKAITLLEELA